MTGLGRALLVLLALAAPMSACRREDPTLTGVTPPPPAIPTSHSTSVAASPSPAPASTIPPPAPKVAARLPSSPVEAHVVEVPDELSTFAVPGRGGTCPRIVFLGGMCVHGLGYIQAFQFAAHEHGGVMALQGDIDCGNGVFRKYMADPARQDARIRKARSAVCGDAAGDADEITIVGYSQGAWLAEAMAQRFPERYARVVLIGAPKVPSVARLRQARGAVMISGTLDAPYRMKQGAEALRAAGVPATYLEMPGARHGQLLDAERLMGEALTWLDANARPAP